MGALAAEIEKLRQRLASELDAAAPRAITVSVAEDLLADAPVDVLVKAGKIRHDAPSAGCPNPITCPAVARAVRLCAVRYRRLRHVRLGGDPGPLSPDGARDGGQYHRRDGDLLSVLVQVHPRCSITWQGVLGTAAVLIGVVGIVVLELSFTYIELMERLFQACGIALLDGVILIGVAIALLAILELEKRMQLALFPAAGDQHKSVRSIVL